MLSLGTPSKIELQWPKRPAGAARKFRYAHYWRAQAERSEVTFSVGKYAYAIFDYWDGDEKDEYTQGVRVVAAGSEHESVFECKGEATSNLNELEGKVPCNNGSALAQCN
jgi:hypothetical protein